MGLDVIIRRAEPDDAEGLTHLARAAKASWGYPEDWLQEWAPQLTFSTASLANQSAWVAEFEDVLVGVVALAETPAPEIAHLWIAPRLQRCGVGRVLLARALAEARARGWTEMRVESDPFAVPFYESQGAVVIGEVAAPVGGTDRVLPVLRLVVPQEGEVVS